MKIQKYEVFPLSYPEPNDNLTERYITLVKLTTSDGVVGWGEAITQLKAPTLATVALLENGLLDEVVLGRDPLQIETIWNALKEAVWWYGDKGGIAAFAISAIDMALWDIKGKVLDLPLYQLLGGLQQEKIPACASTHPKASNIEDMAAELAAHIEAGYKLVKAGFGKRGDANLGTDPQRDIAFVRAVREAIGDEAGFIVDVGAKTRWTLPQAVKMARAFLPYKLTWLEDPFQPDNFSAFEHLRAAVPEMMLGFGERFWNLQDYKRLLDADLCDVILIDPGRAEGITGMQRITQLAALYNVKMDPHSWSSAINTAASLHVAYAAPNASIFEFKPVQNPMQHELVANPICQVGGYACAPQGPGLGVEVIESTVRRYDARKA